MGMLMVSSVLLSKVRKFALGCLCASCLLVSHPVFADSILDLFMSPADEQRIGEEEHPKILKAFGGAYEDPRLTPYIRSIGQFLVQTTETPDAKFTFTILNTPLVNAFALPGGYIYVTRGLLALGSNEAEIAGVLAHEIAHVTARHSAGRAANAGIAELGLIILGVLGGNSAVSKIGEVGALALIQSYSREDEFEADSLGVGYLSRAGFKPEAMSTFLEKLDAHSSFEAERLGVARDAGIDFFATHPRTPERVARAIQLAGIREVNNPIVAHELYLNKIDGMLFGDSPEQGMHIGRFFIHPVLGFEFEVPKNFSILNGSEKVVGRSKDGAVFQFDSDTNEGNELEYYVRYQWAKGESLMDITRRKIGGFPSVSARIAPGSQDDKRLWLFAIEFDSRTIYRFILAIPTNLSDSRSSLIQGLPLSFRPLGKEVAAAIRPNRLKIYRVSEEDNAVDLAAGMQISEFGLERFLIMNGLKAGEKLTPGIFVKLVGY